MPTTTRTVYLTDENGNALIDAKGNMRTLSFSLVQGFSYRLVERASIVSATYAQVVGYSTATGQTIAGVENASEFDVGDFGIVRYAISDRNNTIGYVTCEVTAVRTDSLTVNGIGISVAGADGKDGAPGADGKNGATFTPSVDTNGDLSWTNDGGLPNPETVNLRGAQGEAATVQVGQVTTLPAGSQATVTNSGTNQATVLNFGIPKGQPGADGAAATIEVGEVTTGAAGTQASVTNSGTTSAAVFDFTIPKGADGASGVTDVTAGTPTEQDGYTVTPVTFDFEQGNNKTVEVKAKNGADGIGVPAGGTTGQVLKKKSDTDYDTEWANESGGSSTSNEVIDLGTVTLTGTNEEFSGTVTITSEQFTKMKAETPPIVNFEWSGDTYSLSRFQLVPNVGGGRTLTLFSGTYAAREGGVAAIQSAVLRVSAGSTTMENITAKISIYIILLPNEESGGIGGGGGTAEVTKEAIATALNLSTTQLDVLVSLAQKVTITGNDVKFATGTVLKSSFFDAVD